MKQYSTTSQNRNHENKSNVFEDPFFREILEQQKSYLDVCAIREELIETALDQCYKKYLERQRVSFLVHCLHSAWCKCLEYAFMDCSKVCQMPSAWTEDRPPRASPKDSWSEYCVQLETKPPTTEETETVEENLDELSVHPTQVSFTPNVSLASEKFREEAERCRDGGVEEAVKHHGDYEESEELYGHWSDHSFFTQVKKAAPNKLPPIEAGRCTSEPGVEEVKMKALVKSGRVNVADFITKLPPIKCRPKTVMKSKKVSDIGFKNQD